MAQRQNIQAATLSRIETATTTADLPTLSALTHALGVSLGDVADAKRARPRPRLSDVGVELLKALDGWSSEQRTALLLLVQRVLPKQ